MPGKNTQIRKDFPKNDIKQHDNELKLTFLERCNIKTY